MSGKSYYECHITIEEPDKVKARVAVESMGWKFSAIDGDPALGAGVRCYATRHYNAARGAYGIIGITSHTAQCLADMGLHITRRKVELVIFDDHSASVRPAD